MCSVSERRPGRRKDSIFGGSEEFSQQVFLKEVISTVCHMVHVISPLLTSREKNESCSYSFLQITASRHKVLLVLKMKIRAEL